MNQREVGHPFWIVADNERGRCKKLARNKLLIGLDGLKYLGNFCCSVDFRGWHRDLLRKVIDQSDKFAAIQAVSSELERPPCISGQRSQIWQTSPVRIIAAVPSSSAF